MRSKNLFLRIPCALWKRLLLCDKGSGLTCLPTNGTKKMLFQPKSQNWSCAWDVIMIKMKEKSTALFIGIRWDRDCEMRSWSMEAQNSRTWTTSLGEATRSSSNAAWVSKIKKITEEVLSIVLQVSSQDSLLGEEQARMDDKQFSSHPSIRNLRMNKEKYWHATNFTKRRMEHYRSKWRISQDSVYWVNLARAQGEWSQFCQTRSNAIVVYSSVPSECIYKVISRNGERVLFERLATPRPPPKVVLKSSWQTQQQLKTLLGVYQVATGKSLRKFWWRKRWKGTEE